MGFDGATVMILVLLLLAVVLVLVFLRYVPLGLWVRALSSGVKVKVSALIGMRLRRISPHRLVDTLIMVRKAGLDITLDQLEKHLLAANWLPEFVQYCKDKGVAPNQQEIAKSKPLIIRLVNAYIVRNILGDEGFFPLFERDDEITKKAVETIGNYEL